MRHLRWWQRVNAWSWIYPSNERRRWWSTVVGAAAVGAVFLLLPFVDEWLYPQFSRYLPVMGRPPDTGERLAGGVLMLLIVLILIWADDPNRRRPD